MATLAAATRRQSCDRCRKHKVRCTREGRGKEIETSDPRPCERCRKARLSCSYSPQLRLGRIPSQGQGHNYRPSTASSSIVALPPDTCTDGNAAAPTIIDGSYHDALLQFDADFVNCEDWFIQQHVDGEAAMTTDVEGISTTVFDPCSVSVQQDVPQELESLGVTPPLPIIRRTPAVETAESDMQELGELNMRIYRTTRVE